MPNMRVAVIRKPGSILVEERPRPAPDSDQVLVKPLACGVCGTDLAVLDGRRRVNYPYVPGHEAIAVVEGWGAKVRGLQRGQTVALNPNCPCGECFHCRRGAPNLCENLNAEGCKSNGCFAEYACVRAGMVHVLPPCLPANAGVLTEPLSCALHAFKLAGLYPGQSALVVGGGTMGLLLLQLARHAGAGWVGVTDPVASRRLVASRLGADATFDPATRDTASQVHSIWPRGVDVVWEAAGHPEAASAAVQSTRRGGSAILVGVIEEVGQMSLPAAFITRNEVSVRGSWLNPFTFAPALELLSAEWFDANPFLTHRYPLDEIASAYDMARSGEAVKVMVTMVD